jgi:hypothetical protein
VETILLECGCERTYIGGDKWMWIYCEEHDVDNIVPSERPITKFKKYHENE